jgi:hypothetical protein
VQQDFISLLSGNDLRSIGLSNSIVKNIRVQKEFDKLFSCLVHENSVVVMRSADAVEKITRQHPEYLFPHTAELYRLLEHAHQKELKWHIAQLITRVHHTAAKLNRVVKTLTAWALDQYESKIVRVNAIQGLSELAVQYPKLKINFMRIINIVEKENIPSINARIRKLRKDKTPE